MRTISIIIPCFNAERTIMRCLKSVYTQIQEVYPWKLEVIVVDDGSRDLSIERIKNCAAEYNEIRIFKHENNRGVLAARSSGVYEATGDFLMFLDADDEYLPGSLSRITKQLNMHSQDILQFETEVVPAEGCFSINCDRTSKKLHRHIENIDSDYTYCIHKKCFEEMQYTYTIWNKVYRTDIVKKAYRQIQALGEHNIVMSDDLLGYYVISLLAKSYSYSDIAVYRYTYGSGISCNNSDDPYGAFLNNYKSYDAIRLLETFHQVYPEYDLLKDEVKKLEKHISERLRERFVAALSDEDKKKAILMLEYRRCEEKVS